MSAIKPSWWESGWGRANRRGISRTTIVRERICYRWMVAEKRAKQLLKEGGKG
jgi:hypothetical protein